MDLLQAAPIATTGSPSEFAVAKPVTKLEQPGSDQYHSRSPGHATYAGGDERGVLFMPADYRLDFGIQECVEDLFLRVCRKCTRLPEPPDFSLIIIRRLFVGRLCIYCTHLFSPSARARAAVSLTYKEVATYLPSATGLRSSGQCVLKPDLRLTNLLPFSLVHVLPLC
jgi:hypothetical protein